MRGAGDSCGSSAAAGTLAMPAQVGRDGAAAPEGFALAAALAIACLVGYLVATRVSAMAQTPEWVPYFADEHGRPRADGNDHLTPDQRAELTRRADERAQARGACQAVVVVDVYANGEAVPQVQFPHESALDQHDREQVNDVVRLAANVGTDEPTT